MTSQRLVIGLILLVCLATTVQAQQSTTGPVPPPGIDHGLAVNKATAWTIPNVPSYIWHHGCGPTAVGMVVGFWDREFFDCLIEGDASTQTTAVNAMIADDSQNPVCGVNPGADHYQDYSCPRDSWPVLLTDLSELGGAHIDNCVADFMYTSQSAHLNYYGWSWSNHIARSFTEYVALCCPLLEATAYDRHYSGFSWDDYMHEINQGRPVVLLVDTDGDGESDHFVTGIGYDEPTMQYIFYNTWDHTLHNAKWRGLAPGNTWGIYGVTTFDIVDPMSPVISVTPASCEFGIVAIGACATPEKTFIVRNVGEGTLFGGAYATWPFDVVSGETYSLPVSATHEVIVGFCPTASDEYSGMVYFTGGGGASVPASGRGCGCAFQSDFDEDGFLTALDLATMIDILFAGQPDIQDPNCPNPRADFDCDGFSTALDLSGLIDHLFAGGDGPCDPCGL
jgi:hypothetical protein